MSFSYKKSLKTPHSYGESPPKRARYEKIDVDPKYNALIKAVFDQGPIGEAVFIENENDTPFTILQHTLNHVNIPLNVLKDPTKTNEYVLKIGNEVYAEGTFDNIQSARATLAEIALSKLKKKCFFIKKKKNYVDITNEHLAAVSSGSVTKFEEAAPVSDESNSKAHRMMQKMGWTEGKGLGSKEQGNVDTIVIYENISRRGLGNKNVMKEITQVLDNFAKSTKFLTILAFDSDFTKDERDLIHKVARKFNLKSKSEGKEPNRRITVSRKLTRAEIVKELLNIGGENGSYKLHIPTNFSNLLD